MNILSLVLLLGALQGFILSLVLFFSKFNQKANKIFSISIFIISIALVFAYFHVVLDYKYYTFFIKSTLPLSLIFVPLIYIYTKIITNQEKQIHLKEIKYFIPFFIVFIYNIPFYLGSELNKIEYLERETLFHNSTLIDRIEVLFVSLTVFLFSILIFSNTQKMKKNYELQVSNYRLELFKMMSLFSVCVLLFSFIGFFLSFLHLVNLNYPDFLEFLSAIGTTFLIYFIGYYILRNPDLFHPFKEAAEPKPDENTTETNEDLFDNYFSKMIKSLTIDKVYRDPELTLNKFSLINEIPTYLCSKVIKSKTSLNFYNFINSYRIEEIKVELLKTDSPQIMQIAYTAGFNTKSSFYNYFKKDTDLSPKEFIEKNKKSI